MPVKARDEEEVTTDKDADKKSAVIADKALLPILRFCDFLVLMSMKLALPPDFASNATFIPSISGKDGKSLA